MTLADHYELIVSGICIFTLIVLVGVYYYIENTYYKPDVQKGYSVSLEGNETASYGNVTLVVGNNSKASDKSLGVYGLTDKESRIFSSMFATGTGKIIEQDDILFAGNSTLKIGNASSMPKITNISVKNGKIDPGDYHGWMYVGSGIAIAFPVTISTEPRVLQAIIIIVVGILASLSFWEIALYIDRMRNEGMVRQEATNIKRLSFLTGNDLTTKRTEIKEKAMSRLIVLSKRYSTNADIVFSLDAAFIGFGIATGLLGVLNTGYVTTITDMSTLSALTLLGYGLGIGSLKQLVESRTAK
jgi:hypothetical protein